MNKNTKTNICRGKSGHQLMGLVTLKIMCLPIPEFLPPLSPYV